MLSLRRFARARVLRGVLSFGSAALVAAAVLPTACSSATERETFDSDAGTGGASGENPGGPADGGIGINTDGKGQCSNLECQVDACEGQPKTTITGKVYDPAGKIPLYNAIVYVPNTRDLPPVVQGASCDRCGTLAVDPVVSALSGIDGSFTLENVPAGEDIPVVVQIGKWRKELRITVDPCKENELEDKLTLPKNQQEGSMPRIAVSAGGEDALACLLSRIGVDDDEFTLPGEGGAVQVFGGTGASPRVNGDTAPQAKAELWDSLDHLKAYDLVLLACDSAENNQDRPIEAKERMRDYLNAGGRVFATHYHFTWFRNGPADMQSVASWGESTSASFATKTFSIARTFPKGEAFGDWLEEVGASDNGSDLDITEYAPSIDAANDRSQRWVYDDSEHPVKYLSFNTPVEAEPELQCGRGVISDIHVGTGNDNTVPSGCGSAALSPQEKALLFLLMDLSSCVQDDSTPPVVPN